MTTPTPLTPEQLDSIERDARYEVKRNGYSWISPERVLALVNTIRTQAAALEAAIAAHAETAGKDAK